MDFTGALTQKLGPLPGYAYVVIGVGGIFLFRKLKPSNSSGGYVPTSMAAGETPAPALMSTAIDQEKPSNESWALQAANHLKRTSVFKDSDIATALFNYLSGAGLTSSQQNIVNAAIGANGFPSGGLIPVYSADVPTPTVLGPAVNPYVNLPYTPYVPAVTYYDPPAVTATRNFDPGFYVAPVPTVPGAYVSPVVTLNPYVAPTVWVDDSGRPGDNVSTPIISVAPAPTYSSPQTQGTVDMAGIA